MALNIQTINDADDPCLLPFRNIREKDLVGREHHFIAEGKVVLQVLLQSKRLKPLSLVVVAAKLLSLMPLLEKYTPSCPIYCVPQKVMNEIAGFPVHRGMLGLGERIMPPSLDETLATLPEEALVPVLCGISNHDNMGAIFRNSAAFSADCVILDKTCCDPLYRKSIRVSVGAALKVPYTQGETIETIMSKLTDSGFEIFALSPAAPSYLNEARRAKRAALLFGTEGDGLPKQILKQARTLRIPIAYDFDSLNVATATGIALSHFADPNRLN